eukprot:3236526-Rhodomonas_salina.1
MRRLISLFRVVLWLSLVGYGEQQFAERPCSEFRSCHDCNAENTRCGWCTFLGQCITQQLRAACNDTRCKSQDCYCSDWITEIPRYVPSQPRSRSGTP